MGPQLTGSGSETRLSEGVSIVNGFPMGYNMIGTLNLVGSGASGTELGIGGLGGFNPFHQVFFYKVKKEPPICHQRP
jgi:hypothetical protein